MTDRANSPCADTNIIQYPHCQTRFSVAALIHYMQNVRDESLIPNIIIYSKLGLCCQITLHMQTKV